MATVAATAGVRPDYTEYSRTARWIIMLAVMLGTILEVLDTSIVNVAIPDMMGNLGATIDQIGWVSTGYIIANVIVLPLTGWLSNHFGRRNYLVGSIILFTAASFLCGTAHTLNQLVIYRVLQGAGGAALLSTAQATLLEVFPRKQVAGVQAIFTMGLVAAPTLGPTLGGYITDNFSWPWIFFINVPIGVLAAFLVFYNLKDSKFAHAKRKIDLVGIGLLAVGLGSLQTVLEKGRSEGWFESTLILVLSLSAITALGTFVWWELRVDEPAVQLRILKNRSFAAGAVFSVVLGCGLYGGIFILPIYLQEVRHYSAEQSGLMLMPGGLTTALCLPFIGRAVRRFQPRSMVALGAILFAASMIVMRTVNNQTGPENFYLPLILRGLSMGLMFLPLTIAALSSLTPQEVPYGTGLFNLMRQLGGSAGIAILSTVLEHRAVLHRTTLADHVTLYNQPTVDRLNQMQQFLMSKGASLGVAKQQALAALDGILTRESLILAFEDCFLIIGVSFVLALPLLLMFKKAKIGVPIAAGGH